MGRSRWRLRNDTSVTERSKRLTEYQSIDADHGRRKISPVENDQSIPPSKCLCEERHMAKKGKRNRSSIPPRQTCKSFDVTRAESLLKPKFFQIIYINTISPLRGLLY